MKKQHGFTLVELAIVLMIIGLLIGGVLRGQELMTNAKVTASVKQFQSYKAATTTFMDIYFNLPGDIANPGSTIPNCTTAPCNVGGNGDGKIDGTESNNFWIHLSNAHLVTGVNVNATSPIELSPKSTLGGAYIWASGTPTTYQGTSTYSIGNGFFTYGLSTGLNRSVTTPKIAAQIDRKMDDGLPNTGEMIQWQVNAQTYDTTTTCQDGTNYNEAIETRVCAFAVKM